MYFEQQAHHFTAAIADGGADTDDGASDSSIRAQNLANNVEAIWDIVRVIPAAEEQIRPMPGMLQRRGSVLGIQSKFRRQLGSL